MVLRFAHVALLAVMAGGALMRCSVAPFDSKGKACDLDHPCPNGFACVYDACWPTQGCTRDEDCLVQRCALAACTPCGDPRPCAPNDPCITDFTLVKIFDTGGKQSVQTQELVDGSRVSLSELGTNQLNIAAVATATVASVKLRGDFAVDRVENGAPFTLLGDISGGDYFAWTATLGRHWVSATPYASKGAVGSAGQERSVCFEVTP